MPTITLPEDLFVQAPAKQTPLSVTPVHCGSTTATECYAPPPGAMLRSRTEPPNVGHVGTLPLQRCTAPSAPDMPQRRARTSSDPQMFFCAARSGGIKLCHLGNADKPFVDILAKTPTSACSCLPLPSKNATSTAWTALKPCNSPSAFWQQSSASPRSSPGNCYNSGLAILEQYGVFGAAPGAWSQQARSSVVQSPVGSQVTSNGSADPTFVSSVHPGFAILEQYGVFGAPSGMWVTQAAGSPLASSLASPLASPPSSPVRSPMPSPSASLLKV